MVSAQLLAHHELGGTGPEVLVLLHATGFHGHMLKPMASELSSRFRCIAIDLPGHGASAHVALPSGWQPQDVAAYVAFTLSHLGLRQGCFCFGHSWGGNVALTLEVLHPGTFAAIDVYEPVVSTKALRQNLLARPYTVPMLVAIAKKRRSRFASYDHAQQQLKVKPPFSKFLPEVTQLYVEHGMRPSQVGEGVELCCRPDVEASVYLALEPPPALDFSKVLCPVTIALGRHVPGVHERLLVLGAAVHAEIPGSKLERFPELSHLGPYEKPHAVARSMFASFKGVSHLAGSRQVVSKL